MVIVPLTFRRLIGSIHTGIVGEALNPESGLQTLHSPVSTLICEPRKDPPFSQPQVLPGVQAGRTREPSCVLNALTSTGKETKAE